MAIIARVASHGITPALDLTVTVQFFDDNDPANQGVGAGGEPGAVLQADSWTYPPTMNGAELQQHLAADIRARGALFLRARAASADAKQFVPVGALVNVEA